MQFDISDTCHPISSLLQSHVLSAPARPGILAQLDRFEILGIHEETWTCLLFLARDTVDQSQVVLKMLKPAFAEKGPARSAFELAAARMQQMQHPGILEIKAVSAPAAKAPFFAAPCLGLNSLAEKLSGEVQMDPAQVRQIFLQLTDALRYAHTNGALHGNLKPSNILFRTPREVVLTDFGMVQLVGAGTHFDPDVAAYQSPGVIGGEVQDTRRDIYALGAILYHLLTGHPPYQGRTAEEISARITAGPPAPILELNPDADPSLARIAEKAMARKLRNTYADMADFHKALADRDAGRAWRVGLGLLLVLAIAAASGISFWLGSRSAYRPRVSITEYSSATITATPAQPLIFPGNFSVPQLRVEDVQVTKPGTAARIILGAKDGSSGLSLGRISTALSTAGRVALTLERIETQQGTRKLFGPEMIGPIKEAATRKSVEFRDNDLSPGCYTYQLWVRTDNAFIRGTDIGLNVEVTE